MRSGLNSPVGSRPPLYPCRTLSCSHARLPRVYGSCNKLRNVITLHVLNARMDKAMTLLSIQPRPCTDSNCRGQHAPAERVALAMSLCGARGTHLTTLRRQILELLWESGRPTGAYELIEALKLRDSRPIGPPTVYRALEFLMSQGLVSKI
ncbi:MAG: hypothetical protein FJX65_19795, partial [Alphaproteobacteria bacterium]|nr:hypothetical protein [Alphaproteobacteria bacterium]